MNATDSLNVLVTGVSGMLGRSLAMRLATSGHEVLGMDIHPCDLQHARIKTEVLDVRDLHQLYRLLKDSPPIDVVVHGGGISGSMVLKDRPAEVADINVGGTMNLLEAMRLYGIPRIVQCSTIMVYGEVEEGPVDEERSLAPTNVYGATKAACEALITSYVAQFGMSAALLRIAHVYGPARKTYCPLRAMIEGALDKRDVSMHENAGAKRQLIHADDVVHAMELATLDRNPGRVVANIAPGVEWRMDEVAEIVRGEIGPLAVEFGNEAIKREYLTAPLAIDRARERWGWSPKVSLSEGVADFLRAGQ
ncbi:NAD-dependent epimerase/dehydratase family protein [Billgrantia endophytica]|uniref:NAD-dependent epimerase/dehydratase domain-containing protein n=1 Tax=Billgrantia endophytica TaxID=2033802 RepID=A0A2N7UEB2_9GAMM|nr:NAD(P)-dependent oxidoreductase [Halomonas endophytica]PMR78788.1 hypothetical protein C1H69_00545 [Halomonas endophytica]